MQKWHKIWEKPRFFFIFSLKIVNSFIIDLYSFIIGIKDVINVILNNIDLQDRPSRMHRSSDAEIQNWSSSVLIRTEVVRNCILNNLFLHENSYFALFSLREPPKLTKLKIWWFLNLIQLFPITRYTVLVGIKVVRNYVRNNFELPNQLSSIHSFHSKSLWSWQNSDIS